MLHVWNKNDVDAVYCKKCATSLSEADEEIFTPSQNKYRLK